MKKISAWCWRISFCALLLAFPVSARPQEIPFQSDYFHLMEEGVSHYKKSDFEKARDSFSGALLLRPDDPNARHNLGLALAKMKEYQSANSEFTELKESVEELERKALQDYHRGVLHQEQAEAIINPTDTDANPASETPQEPDYDLAKELALQSLTYFNEALKNRPDYSEAQKNREAVQRMLKQIGERPVPPPSNQSQNGEDENQDQQDEQDQENQSENSDQQQDQQNDQNSNPEDQSGNSDSQDNQSDSNQSENEQGESEEQQDQPSEMQGSPQEKQDAEQGEDQEGSQPDSEEEQKPTDGDEEQRMEENDETSNLRQANSESDTNTTPTMTRAQAEALLQLLGNTQPLTISAPQYNPDLRKGPDW